MSYTKIKGNIFASKCQVLGNTVNCVGDMGKGIALEFRRRFPEMLNEYKKVCEKGLLRPGDIFKYPERGPARILNFAVKDHWRYPSKEIWVQQCLEKFCSNYKKWEVNSIALPLMGTKNGGLSELRIEKMTRDYLAGIDDLVVEEYEFDPNSEDPLLRPLREALSNRTVEEFASESGLQKNKVIAIHEFNKSDQLKTFNDLITSRVIGATSIDKLYYFLNSYENKDSQFEMNFGD